MFVFTMNKNSLQRAGATVLCMACLAGAVAGVNHVADRSVAASAQANVKVESTQDIGTFFSDRGVELDLTTASVDEVKIPKRWDDSFMAFNTVVEQSDLSLEGFKGKTVEKWTALCPGRSGGEEKSYGVLLVYKGQAVGAYLITQPGGEVTGVGEAAQSMALAEEEAEEVSADATDVSDLQAEAAEAAGVAESQPEEDVPAAAEETEPATEVSADADTGPWPVE